MYDGHKGVGNGRVIVHQCILKGQDTAPQWPRSDCDFGSAKWPLRKYWNGIDTYGPTRRIVTRGMAWLSELGVPWPQLSNHLNDCFCHLLIDKCRNCWAASKVSRMLLTIFENTIHRPLVCPSSNVSKVLSD
jgi:hypothetical protein